MEDLAIDMDGYVSSDEDEPDGSAPDAIDKSAPIRSISRSIAILQAINRAGSLSMTGIAQAAKVPYPTACRIMQTLAHEGLVEREPTRKRYRATSLVQSLSCGFQEHGSLVAAARPHIVELTRRLHWPISVATHAGHSMIVRDSTHTLTSLTFNNYYPGYSMPILASASGRLYLAFADDEERENLLSGLDAAIDEADRHTLKLFRSGFFIEEIRRDGYATMTRNFHTANPGKTSSIAVPVMHGGRIAGALTMIFFSSALKTPEAVEALLPDLKATAEAVMRDLATAEDR